MASSSAASGKILPKVEDKIKKSDIPDFRTGDTVKVAVKIIEGQKERVQAFQGVVIKRHHGVGATATFTVRKISYNIGVERTFLLHSPRIESIEVIGRGEVRRARLFYLRPLRGKQAKISTTLEGSAEAGPTAEKESSSPAA